MQTSESSRLIKAHAARQLGAGGTFPVNDMQRQWEEQGTRVSRQAAEMLAQAARDAQEIRRRAYEEGFAEGQEAGIAASRELIEDRAAQLAGQYRQEALGEALPAFRAVAQALEAERDAWLAEWEQTAIRLSAAMAEKIIHRKIAADAELPVGMIREVLRRTVGSQDIVVHLHPQDHEQLQTGTREIQESLARVGELTLVSDDTVARGGCWIETRHGTIDGRIESQLARIVDELFPLG
ncbi:MAG: FliH/SctL family protein [Planctomycetales bacterium]